MDVRSISVLGLPGVLLLSTTAFASPPKLPTDMLKQGELSLQTEYLYSGFSGAGEAQISGIKMDLDSTGKTHFVNAEIQAGILDNLVASISTSYVPSLEMEQKYVGGGSSTTARAEAAGIDDLTISARMLVSGTENNGIETMLSVVIPSGNDDEGQAELIVDGAKVQNVEQGGIANGRTDFTAGLAYRTMVATNQIEVTASYTLVGNTKDGAITEENGDQIDLTLQALHPISDTLSFALGGSFSYEMETKAGTATTDPSQMVSVMATGYYTPTPNLLIKLGVGYGVILGITEKDSSDGSEISMDSMKLPLFGIGVGFSI